MAKRSSVRRIVQWSALVVVLPAVLPLVHGQWMAHQKTGHLLPTDIIRDPDVQQSRAQLRVDANDFQIKSLIASASGTAGELKKRVTPPQWVRDIVRPSPETRREFAWPMPEWARSAPNEMGLDEAKLKVARD